MKKFLVGMVCGFLIAIPVGANASDLVNTIIGKSVQGEFPVTIDGKKLDFKAAVIDGTSYLPVRSVGEALNQEVTFNADLGIELKSKGGAKPPVDPEVIKAQLQRSKHIEELTDRINVLMQEEERLQPLLAPYERDWFQADGSNLKKEKDSNYYDAASKLDAIKKELDQKNAELQAAVKENNDIAEAAAKKSLLP